MKRTPLKRKTPLRSKTPLQSKTPLKRTGRLRPVSKKRQKLNRDRAKFVAHQLELRQWCEAGPHITRHLVSRLTETQKRSDSMKGQTICQGKAVDIHEPLTRARGGSILDVDNTVALCRSCHDWIHEHPREATQLGLLKRMQA